MGRRCVGSEGGASPAPTVYNGGLVGGGFGGKGFEGSIRHWIGREEAGVVGGDAGADGFAVVVGAEGILEFGLGVVDGLEEGLGHVGDGAGGARLDVAADYGGEETGEGGA